MSLFLHGQVSKCIPALAVLKPSILLSLLQIVHSEFSQCLWWTPKSINVFISLLEIVSISVFESKGVSSSFKLSCDPQKFIYLRQHLDSLGTQNTHVNHINSSKVLQAYEQCFISERNPLKMSNLSKWQKWFILPSDQL